MWRVAARYLFVVNIYKIQFNFKKDINSSVLLNFLIKRTEMNKNTVFIFISISLILMIKFDGKKLSLEECSKILNKEGNIYTKVEDLKEEDMPMI